MKVRKRDKARSLFLGWSRVSVHSIRISSTTPVLGWDLDFKLLDDRDQLVAEISKQVFTLTSTYQVSVYEEEYANLVISLCLAIDYVEMMENGS